MKAKDNILSDYKCITPIKCHKTLRNTLSPHSLLIDAVGHKFNGLKYTLIARNNLIHRYAQDWIINSLKSIGFSFVPGSSPIEEPECQKEIPHYFSQEKLSVTDIVRGMYTKETNKFKGMDELSPMEKTSILREKIDEMRDVSSRSLIHSLKESALKELFSTRPGHIIPNSIFNVKGRIYLQTHF